MLCLTKLRNMAILVIGAQCVKVGLYVLWGLMFSTFFTRHKRLNLCTVKKSAPRLARDIPRAF
jgi:hypothetical protein